MPHQDVARRPWWRDVATLVAVLGLVAALTFNTLGMRQQVEQSKRDREANEIATFTQLTALAREAESRLPEIEDDICGAQIPSQSARADLKEVAYEYDFLAWLFNHGHITLPSAREYWVPSMLKTWQLAATVSISDALSSYRDLGRFRQSVSRRLWPKVTCR